MTLPLIRTDSIFIGGSWVKGTGEPEAVINPATEEIIGFAPVGSAQDVDAAIGAARHAFDKGPWPRMKAVERAAVLSDFIDRLEARRADIVRLIQIEAGAVSTVIPIQYDFGIMLSRDAIRNGQADPHTHLASGVATGWDGSKSFVGGTVRREPVGVISAITPYNYPFLLNLIKIVPALMMGNTVVLKPSPFTPFAALLVAEVAAQCAFPEGALSIVTGGKEVGELMTTDPRVDLITFTGSDAVGAAIAAQAAPTLKRLHLELGGKSAHIVRADADLHAAAADGMSYLWHSAQGCAAPTRHLVHNSVRARYVEILADAHRALKIGNPEDPNATFGPLIRESQRAKTEHYVAEGLREGGTLVTGGKRPTGFDKGFFFEPTLFDNVDNKSVLAQQEVFGPVGCVVGFDTDEQAVDMANDSAFGLAGNIWSGDLVAAHEMACAIRTGRVAINGGGSVEGSPITPFGGFKRSGLGREWGTEGLYAFTEIKAIHFRAP